MRVPSAEGGPEARIQTPETERCQTPDHQTTSPPGIRTHQVSLECMCLLVHPLTPSPPRSPSRPKARRRRRSSSYARSASPASRMRCTTCSRGRPKRRYCVCESRGSLPAVPRCASGSRGVAARELHGRPGVQARHGCPRPQLAQGGAVLIFRSRPAVSCPHCSLPHRLQAAAAQRGRRRRHRHGHRHVIATGPSTTPF